MSADPAAYPASNKPLDWMAEPVVVGRFGIEPHRIRDRLEGEFAWMVRRDCRGQGLATEAARALIRFASEQLELTRLFATTHPDNSASIGLMAKVGLVQTLASPEALVFELPPRTARSAI